MADRLRIHPLQFSGPGGHMRFENAPFKLTTELVEVMGGQDSELFARFTLLAISMSNCNDLKICLMFTSAIQIKTTRR